jgi:hypothetical protein
MAKTTVTSETHARRGPLALLNVAAWAVAILLALVVAAEVVFFAIRAAHLLGYPYPLDYGEGPLLAQVQLLRAGTPIWRLYADPAAPPYQVINYPPLYHLLSALLSLAVGDILLAGRLISLAATIAAGAALWPLTDDRPTTQRTGQQEQRTKNKEQATDDKELRDTQPRSGHPTRNMLIRSFIVLAFLGLPIIRHWGVLMRVDMLGLALGLWGLVLVRRNAGRRRVLWAALPLVLTLFVKPSLVAAPAAALAWLLFRDWRRAVLLALLMAIGGGLTFALLYAASGGWFGLHVLTANANRWEFDLAHAFWFNQMVILLPLILAGTLSVLSHLLTRRTVPPSDAERPALDLGPRVLALLPLYYTLFGAIDGFGVGKVGAYLNYFLEFYTGLIWLAASVARPLARPPNASAVGPARRPFSAQFGLLASLLPSFAALFVVAGLMRYFPLWSANYLQLAGIIEGVNPPRVSFGRYGVWQDLQRERAVLTTFAHVNAALNDEVRAAGAPIFTDIAGVAAQAGRPWRIQMFEHIMLHEAGAWDQRPLLRDLANGRVPLVVLDYLGNWMTKEMVTTIKHRYAQDGSRGTYDLYRPAAIGPSAAADMAFSGGPHLIGYHLALSAGRAVYTGGETVLLTLDWRALPSSATERVDSGSSSESSNDDQHYEVVAQLLDGRGDVLLDTVNPLLYGALQPQDWGDDVMQHLQPIRLPPGLPAASYRLAITLRWAGRELAPPRVLTTIVVDEQGGRLLGEQGYFVPKPLLDTWRELGGYEGPGDPLMPAVPFAGYTLQCFVRDCIQVSGQGVERLPLGELIYLVDAGLPPASAQTTAGSAETPIQQFPETDLQLSGEFLTFWRENGDMERLGPPISGELLRGDQIVQYTRYARLQRPASGGAVRLGRLGEEYLRLPGGVAYRWP